MHAHVCIYNIRCMDVRAYRATYMSLLYIYIRISYICNHMYIGVCVYIGVYASLSISIYVYVYIYICIYRYMYIYICMFNAKNELGQMGLSGLSGLS